MTSNADPQQNESNDAILYESNRLYHAYPNASYLLPADEEEIRRLQLQHNIMKTIFGKPFFPPFEKGGTHFILDIGTANGAWMVDMAAEVSTSSIIHGIDIEAKLFPLRHPPNVSFSVNSVIDLPKAWSNRFDYVHQRFLLAALKRVEWHRALEQITEVLVPGGWVEICETGIPTSGPVTKKHIDVLSAFFDRRDMILHIAHEMPSLLTQANFENLLVEKRTIPLGASGGELGIKARDNYINMFRSMKKHILQAGGLGYFETEKEYDEHIDAIEKEWNEIPKSQLEVVAFCAQVKT